jgi:hypothetical protein
MERSGWGTLERYSAGYHRIKEAEALRQEKMRQPEKRAAVALVPVRRVDPEVQSLIDRRSALLQQLEAAQMGDVRRKLWHDLIKIEEATGHGLSKAVSKLYASWFRSASMGNDATLEMDEEDGSIIEWRGIRVNLTQLKEWVIYHIGDIPREHRIAMIHCCERSLRFADLQAVELR